MTEASSFFLLPQTRSTTFLLILNKYIFTFLCYIHYVNILKPMLQKNLTLYLLIVVRKEGLSFPLMAAVALKQTKKTTQKIHMHWLYLACFVLSQDTLRVSAVKRVVEETISIGMSIPHRRSEVRGGVSILYV